MNKFYNTARQRLVLLCTAAIFCIIAVVHAFMYFTIRNLITEEIGVSAQTIAAAISGSIMEDVDEYERFIETRDVNSGYYRRMQKYFTMIKSSGTAIKFIYTERPIDDKTVEFILDAEPIGSEDYSAPGDTTFMDAAGRMVYATGRPAQLPPTVHPEYGALLGGCAPIFGADNKILGAVGVNLDISEMFTKLNSLQFMMLFLYVFILAVCLTLLNRYSGLILEPMIKDKLTGAYRKHYYDVLMRRETRKSMRNGTVLALLMLDLDHFKKINDAYGHAFGDRVLAAAAGAAMRCLRGGDYFIRYGGEEFAVIIPNVNRGKVLEIAERIRASIEKTVIHNEALNIPIQVTVSIGVAHLNGQAPLSGKRVMEMADKALYEAKVTRNTVVLSTEFSRKSGQPPPDFLEKC